LNRLHLISPQIRLWFLPADSHLLSLRAEARLLQPISNTGTGELPDRRRFESDRRLRIKSARVFEKSKGCAKNG
jgi:hypothetical protein